MTGEKAPIGVTPLPPAPPHREATPPAVSFEEAGVPSKVEKSETAPQTLQAAADGPVGFPDRYATIADTTLSIPAEAGILKNDLDPDGEALTVTILDESQTSGDVTLFSDGHFTYTPLESFSGTDTFQYKMRDASLNNSDYVTVSIEVLDPQAPPLPVELASFEAQIDGEAVVLRWTTLTETNNAGFEVEQRTDSTWARIGFVDGFGTTLEPREYVHRIDAVTPGRYAFRLRQVDYDGAVDYSPEVEIHLQPTTFRLTANYPNPFSTTIAFEVPEMTPVRVVVYDLLGRTVATLVDEAVEAGRHDVVWDACDAAGRPVASGVYLYHMEAGPFSQTHRMTLIK